MDPLSAVGFAASILTFIDFSHKLVTGTLEVVDAGATTTNQHTKKVFDDLHRVTQALVQPEFSEASEHGPALSSLASECIALSETLEVELQKLTARSDSK